MKKALVISLVAIVVVTGLPVLMAMSGMAQCHDCGEAVVSMACVLAVLAVGVAMLLLLAGVLLRLGDDRLLVRLHAFSSNGLPAWPDLAGARPRSGREAPL